MTTYQFALRLVQNGADPGVIAHFIRIETEKERAAHPSSHRPEPKRLTAPSKLFPVHGIPKSRCNRLAVAA